MFRGLAIVLGLGVSLIFLELALRLSGLGYGHSPTIDHPVFHHWNPPDYAFRVWGPYNEYGGFDIRTNHDGFNMSRELPAATEPSLIFLGDSFTFGGQVPEEQRFVSIVGRELGATALNFGNNSASALLSRLELEYFADRFRPAAVIYQIYANDIDDDQEMQRLGVRDATGQIVAVPGDQFNWSVRLARQFYVVRLARMTYLKWQYNRNKAARQEKSPTDTWSPQHARPISEMYSAEELENYETNILDIAAFCREKGCPLYLLVIPDRGSLKDGTPDYLTEYITLLAQDHDLRMIDVLPSFRAIPAEELFFSFDIHLTKRGHATLAAAIVEKLKADLPASSENSQPVAPARE